MAGKPVAASLCIRTLSKAGRGELLHRTEQASALCRAPQGLLGLAGLRDDAPSVARGAGVKRAGRPCGARNKADAAREPGIESDWGCVVGSRPATVHGHRSQALQA